MEECVEHKNCRLCKSGELDIILDLGSTPPANNFLSAREVGRVEKYYPLQVCLCKECGSIQLKHTVHPDILFKHYLYESSTSASFRKHFEDLAAKVVEKFNLRPKELVIDIGSNDGILLRPFASLGMRAVGIEPAKNLAEKSLQDGLEVINDYFSPMLAMHMVRNWGGAKIITCTNAFAHIDDLHDIVKGVKTLLQKNGVFIFEIAYIVDAYEKVLFDNQYAEHLFTHGVKPLQKFLASHNLTLVDVERISTHGGSIRCYTQPTVEDIIISDNVSKLIELETSLQLDKVETWQNFQIKIQTSKENITKLLKELKEKGHSIVGYGAPAKTTTLLHYLGLGTETFTFIVDDSPTKQGMFMPGKHIPVLHPDFLLKMMPDYCVLTAWNFADIIIKNNPHYKGKWIKIFPEIEIV